MVECANCRTVHRPGRVRANLTLVEPNVKYTYWAVGVTPAGDEVSLQDWVTGRTAHRGRVEGELVLSGQWDLGPDRGQHEPGGTGCREFFHRRNHVVADGGCDSLFGWGLAVRGFPANAAAGCGPCIDAGFPSRVGYAGNGLRP